MQPKPAQVDVYACGIYSGQPAIIPDSIAGGALFGDLAGAMRPIQVVNQELQGLGGAVIPSTDIVKKDVE